MKDSRTNSVVLLLLLGFALLFAVPVHAQETQAVSPQEFCFQTFLADGSPWVNLKMAKHDMGKGYFLVSGTSFNPATGAFIALGSGSGRVVNGKLIVEINFVNSGKGYVYPQVFYAVFDDAIKLRKANFNGFGNWVKQDNTSEIEYMQGTMKKVTCN